MNNTTYRNVQGATLLDHSPGPQSELNQTGLISSKFSFQVPLDYSGARAGTIKLSATMVEKVAPTAQKKGKSSKEPKRIFVFLCGGPGSANDPYRMPALNRALLAGGVLSKSKFQILYLDYRGTGRSTPVGADTLAKLGNPQKQAEYLKLFRQDNIVRDLEAVRKSLSFYFWGDEKKRWSIMGQSYGGWIALTYLSFCPAGLKEVFLTGGLAPIGRRPDEVYAETYNQVSKQNTRFYKNPLNRDRIRKIVSYLASKANGVLLPSGGRLTVQRFMLLGRSFGGTSGLADIAQLVETMADEIRSRGGLTGPTLERIDAAVKFRGRPLYAALHEAIYCDGPGTAAASNWAAERVGAGRYGYGWLDDAQDHVMFFAGEMIYPFHFDTFAELAPFGAVADLLARTDDWPALYDEAALAANTVPVCAVGYTEDMYVSARMGRETAAKVAGTRYFESPDLAHDAIRTNTDLVLGYLGRMREGLPAVAA